MRTHEEIVNRSWLSEPRKRRPTPKNYVGRKQFYKRYKQLYWKDQMCRIKAGLFQKILYEINLAIVTAIIEEGFEFIPPHNTGKIYVGIKRPKAIRTLENGLLNRAVDTKATLDLWAKDKEAFEKKTKVYFTNMHSNGEIAKIVYTVSKYAIFKGKRGVVFTPARGFKRSVSHVMRNRSLYPNAVYYYIKEND